MPSSASADKIIVVLMTAPDAAIAATIGRALVEERLAACVNIVPAVRSIYIYNSKLCDEQEVLCIFKTRRTSFLALRDRATALHPYEVPEIIALPAAEASLPYLNWILSSTAPVSPPGPR